MITVFSWFQDHCGLVRVDYFCFIRILLYRII
jgi:hypothetical protein